MSAAQRTVPVPLCDSLLLKLIHLKSLSADLEMIVPRSFEYHVPSCPRPACRKAHDFKLLLQVEKGVAHFGGPSDRPGGRSFDVSLRCPVTGELFTNRVQAEEASDEVIQSVSLAEGPIVTPEWLESERMEWIKSSASTARGFAQTMLSTSLGAIPVYFAVLKYIASEANKLPPWLEAAPPTLLLVAATAFVFALRPTYRRIGNQEDFLGFRDARLEQIDRRITAALLVFGLGVLMSVVVFFLSVHE